MGFRVLTRLRLTAQAIKQVLGVFLLGLGLALLPMRAGWTDPPPTAQGETPFLLGCDWPVDGSPAVKALASWVGWPAPRWL